MSRSSNICSGIRSVPKDSNGLPSFPTIVRQLLRIRTDFTGAASRTSPADCGLPSNRLIARMPACGTLAVRTCKGSCHTRRAECSASVRDWAVSILRRSMRYRLNSLRETPSRITRRRSIGPARMKRRAPDERSRHSALEARPFATRTHMPVTRRVSKVNSPPAGLNPKEITSGASQLCRTDPANSFVTSDHSLQTRIPKDRRVTNQNK